DFHVTGVQTCALPISGRRVLFGVTDFDNQWNTGLHTFESAANVIALNAWNHVAAVYEQPTGTRRIYVNGVLIAERSDPPMTVYKIGRTSCRLRWEIEF